MRGALGFAYRLGAAVWVGSVVFFTAGATPAVFATLPREEAARAVAALFPAYYVTGWVAGALALAATLVGGALGATGRRLAAWRAGLLAAMLVASLYAGLVVLPEVRAARAAGNGAGWAHGHRVSVLLNLAVLACGVGLIALPTGEGDRSAE